MIFEHFLFWYCEICASFTENTQVCFSLINSSLCVYHLGSKLSPIKINLKNTLFFFSVFWKNSPSTTFRESMILNDFASTKMRNFNQNIQNLRNLILAKNLYTEGRSLPFINIGLMVHADTLLMFYFICDGGLFTPFNMIEWKTHLSILQGLFQDFAYFFKILLTSFKGFSCFPFPETRLAVTDWSRGILLLAWCFGTL